MMKKVLTEERLCELAGIQEADTVSRYKTQREKAKRARHNVEKDFFGSEDDPPGYYGRTGRHARRR